MKILEKQNLNKRAVNRFDKIFVIFLINLHKLKIKDDKTL